MIRRIAEYTVRADEVDAAQRDIRTFVAAVRQKEPATLYHAYRRGDGPGFIHFMAFPNGAAEDAHRRAPHTQAFVASLYPRCTVEPAFTELVPIEP